MVVIHEVPKCGSNLRVEVERGVVHTTETL